MTEFADVLVVGGGVIGLSIARELVRAGVEDIVVLERHMAVGQESSSRANGEFRAPGRAIAELIRLGRCKTFDLHPFRPSRFDEGDLVVETVVL